MSDKPVRGMHQVLTYGASVARLYAWVTDDFGQAAEPDAAPNITIYDTDGDELIAATAMSAYAGTDSGFISYDAQTAEFSVGTVLTGGTSSATALIIGQQRTGATGILEVRDVSGTFQNNETITDSESGSATEDGTLWQNLYYEDVDISGTSTYGLGKNYSFLIEYDLGTVAKTDRYYFDIAFYPADRPLLTSSDVDLRYPNLIGKCPDEWDDWSPAILSAHSEVVRMIRALGDQADFYLKRREEMWEVFMTKARLRIAEALGESEEKLDYWERQASNAWASRGEFTYDSDQTDAEVDEGVKVIGSSFTR